MINIGIINVREVRELTIEEFIERVEELLFFYGISDFHITEHFSANGKLCYDVSRLKVETENEQVFCSDENNIIMQGFQNGLYVMMSFLRESVKSIKEIYIDELPHAEIEFKDGKVTIEIMKTSTELSIYKPIITSITLSHNRVQGAVSELMLV